VCNVPDYCIDEVSTHTLAFVLALNRHLFGHHTHVTSGKWGGAPGGAPARLTGQVLGLLGLGKIGSAVARKASGLGLKVLAYDPYLKPERAVELGVELVSLEDLLRRSDYLSIHCPLTEQTRHLIGSTQLALMKPTAYLINMARGPVVDQPALFTALVNGTIAGAAMDVLEQEPPEANDPLLKLSNVLVTPHTSSWSSESMVQLRRGVVQNVVQVLRGEPPRAVVNPAVLNRVAGAGS
jgi:D-3-phosphoglycerate dehydrogenase